MPEEPKKEEQRSGTTWTPANMPGYLIGALSLIHLLDDASVVRLRSSLKLWIDAYAGFVKSVNHILFGWIHLWSLKVDETEAHLLIFCALLISAMLRATYEVNPAKLSLQTLAFCVIWGGCALTALILPYPIGSIALFMGLLFFGWMLAFVGHSDLFATPRRVRHHLGNVLMVFLILIAANYTLFPKS